MSGNTLCPKCHAVLVRQERAAIFNCPRCKSTWKQQDLARESARTATATTELLSLDDEDLPNQAKYSRAIVIAALLLILAGGAVATWIAAGGQTNPPESSDEGATGDVSGAGPRGLTGEQVYERLLRSAVFIVTPDGKLGSGSVVDRGRKLVVTNYHVVRGNSRAVVLFPAYDERRQLITSTEHYNANAKTIGIAGKVLDVSPLKDLALIELEQVQDATLSLPLAAAPAPTGASVYSIGASGAERNLLWKLSTGVVSGRSEQARDAPWGPFFSMVLETDAGVNKGDSGGPVVNNRAELVGVVAHYDARQRAVSGNIDVEEVRTFLVTHARKKGWVWPDSVPGSTSVEEAEDVNKLIALLKDSDEVKRLDAVRRLALLGPDARPAYRELLSLLDDANEQVRLAAAAALGGIGTPASADVPGIDALLAAGKPRGRRFALVYYSAEPVRKVPEALLPAVISALSDPSAETRKVAVLALGNYGPGCKSKALTGLLERIADDDPTVAAEAVRVFDLFGPFTDGDRTVLAQYLSDTKGVIRLKAATLLAAETPDAATAILWFRPRLSDADSAVRVRAVEAIAKWGPKSKECLPQLIDRLDDDTASVAHAAVKAVAAVDSGQTTIEALSRLLASNDVKPEVKAVAADTVLTLDLTEPKLGIPVLLPLLASKNKEVRTNALVKLATYGTDAKPALSGIAEALADGEPEVRVAAMKALSQFGPEAAESIPTVAKMLDGRQPEAVALVAADTLARMGPKAIDPLTQALGEKLSKDVLCRVCEGLGRFGREARSAGVAVLNASMNHEALASLATESVKKPVWIADPAASTLAQLGGDDQVAKQLIEWSSYEVKNVRGINTKVPKKGDDVMLWAVNVLGTLDPESLSPKVRNEVAYHIDTLAKYAPTASCRDAAKVARTRHPLRK